MTLMLALRKFQVLLTKKLLQCTVRTLCHTIGFLTTDFQYTGSKSIRNRSVKEY
jgi:hypothetical protein